MFLFKVLLFQGFRFANSQGFLTGVLQAHARRYLVPINTLEFAFKHMTVDELAEQHAAAGDAHVGYSDDGVVVTDLWLEGAAWDADAKCLKESQPGVIHTVRGFLFRIVSVVFSSFLPQWGFTAVQVVTECRGISCRCPQWR